MRIIELIQKNKHIKLAGNEKLRIERELKEPKDRRPTGARWHLYPATCGGLSCPK
jgi:hypothetical protein